MENNITNQNEQKPDNLLVWSILSTVLCCLPLGIVAIIKSNQVDTKWAQGDTDGAKESARQAKLYALIAAGCGVLVFIISFATGLIAALLD